MNSRGKIIALGTGRCITGIVQFAMYVLLLLLGRVFMTIANFAIGIGLVVFLFCLIVRPDMSLPMWAGAGLAVAAMVVSVLYETALSLVAPSGVVIIREV